MPDSTINCPNGGCGVPVQVGKDAVRAGSVDCPRCKRIIPLEQDDDEATDAVESDEQPERNQWVVMGGVVLGVVVVLGVTFFFINRNREYARAVARYESLVQDAEKRTAAKDFDGALNALTEAEGITKVENRERAKELRNAALLEAAKWEMLRGKYGLAVARAEECIATLDETKKQYARQLQAASRLLQTKDSIYSFLVKLKDSDFEAVKAGRLPVEFAMLKDDCGKVLAKALIPYQEKAERRRIAESEFGKWCDHRKYEDGRTRTLYNGYLREFMRLCERESRTSAQRREYEVVKKLHDGIGFGAFLVHYEEALLEVYNVDNYTTDREQQLDAALRARESKILRDVVSAIERNLPQ